MSEHFVGQYEVELKYRVNNADNLLARLAACNAEIFTFENHEKDCYLEVSDDHLAQQNISMILREMNPSGIRLWIIKGPEADRCEASRVEDLAKVQSMLSTLGYQPAFTIEKIRSIYFLDKFHITFDRLTSLGNFAEIAVMTDNLNELAKLKQECTLFAARLGLIPEAVEPRSYRQLLGY
ncbi:class IV adenylate cyclase [Yersinia ruckeri]|uniref:class IV adenylate cyclase n=1 Tax=Yersinia ruckeri TaxID=29486 RepID=UPI0020C12C39|nr:class IV adenylate cyclase [Yersinia ruckeri]MCK8584217.1 class IV adenylate cyclase [Yersinia ruckeri]